MRVSAKWSGEMASGMWSSLEVELDESDLQRFAVKYGWDLDLVMPAQLFLLLDAEANRLIYATLHSKYPNSFTLDDMQEHTVKRDEAIGRIENLIGSRTSSN